MLTKYITTACFLALVLILHVRADDVDPDLVGFPAEIWRQPTNGVSVAMLLGYSRRGDANIPALRIYIKNSSTREEILPAFGDDEFFLGWGRDRAIQAYYLKDDLTRVPLENYNPVIHSATNPLTFTMPPMPSVKVYHPGDMVMKSIDLSPDQLSMLKRYPVVCRIMYSPLTTPTKTVHFVETDPIKVTEKRDGAFRPYP